MLTLNFSAAFAFASSSDLEMIQWSSFADWGSSMIPGIFTKYAGIQWPHQSCQEMHQS